MKPKHLIIATLLLLFFASCNWGEWFEKPIYYLYIPDSLRFPQKTGDSAIFRCIIDSEIIYDTFDIELESEMMTIPNDYDHSKIERKDEVIHLTYKNKSKIFILSEDICFHTDINGCQDIDMEFRTDTDTCSNYRFKDSYIGDLIINGTTYENVWYYKGTDNCIRTYANIKNGLIKYITFENDTFDLYKYIPTN